MTSKEVIEYMTEYDVIDILIDLGSEEPSLTRDGLLFNTICHNGPGEGKKKLHYHIESKTFYCYTECHNIGNIYKLVMKVKECSYVEAYEHVCSMLGIPTSSLKYGFTEQKCDNSFISKFDKKEEVIELPEVKDEKVLNKFWKNLFHESWIKDHISIETMKKFGIRYDIYGYRIIIPHYNENNQLIGIRCRNLDKKKVEDGKKYMPIIEDGIMYNYLTSLNLYGFNINKHNIRKYKKVIIGEAEKFVMQHSTFYENSVSVALCGSSIHKFQIEMLIKNGVEEVILALDKEYSTKEEEEEYKEKIQRGFVSKLCQYFIVSIIWDTENLLDLKMSPTDRGKEVFEKLYQKRIIL